MYKDCRKSSKHFALASENFSKIGQEMLFYMKYIRKIEGDKQLCPFTLL